MKSTQHVIQLREQYHVESNKYLTLILSNEINERLIHYLEQCTKFEASVESKSRSS